MFCKSPSKMLGFALIGISYNYNSTVFISILFALFFMFTISCYALHPLILRYVKLWRHVQVVSECLSNLLWCLCGQWCCDNRMPLSETTSIGTKPSFEAYKFVDTRTLDIGRSSGEPLLPQHLVVDFNPRPEDTKEAENKCQQFWQFVNSQEELKEMIVYPNRDPELLLKEKQPESSTSKPDSSENRDDYPAVHILRRMDKNGGLAAAFTKSCYKSNQ